MIRSPGQFREGVSEAGGKRYVGPEFEVAAAKRAAEDAMTGLLISIQRAEYRGREGRGVEAMVEVVVEVVVLVVDFRLLVQRGAASVPLLDEEVPPWGACNGVSA